MGNNSIEIKLKTLTPLWTGGVDGKCTKIKETGIIGSLRWWYEALVRGLGGYACDPTDSDCKFDYDAYKKTGDIEEGLKNVCDACRLFGCTGWVKRFRLEVDHNPEGFDIYDGYQEDQLFTINIKKLFSISKAEKWLLHSVFYILDKYGTVGAKNMLKPSSSKYYKDWGQVKVVWGESNFEKPDLTLTEVKNELHEPPNNLPIELPDLRYFVFAPDGGLNSKEYWKLKQSNSFFDGNWKDPKANKFASFENKKKFWGYTSQDDVLYRKTKKRLSSLGLKEIKEGKNVLEELV